MLYMVRSISHRKEMALMKDLEITVYDDDPRDPEDDDDEGE